jgi:hypothetical protein
MASGLFVKEAARSGAAAMNAPSPDTDTPVENSSGTTLFDGFAAFVPCSTAVMLRLRGG